jgi:type I restriction enzyme R subunit
MILDKSEMTEEDVKLQFITLAILAKWDCGHVTMETKNSEAQYE